MAQARTYYTVEVVERTGFFTPSDDTEANARQNMFASEQEALTYLTNHGINVNSDSEDLTAVLAQNLTRVDISATGDGQATDLSAICAGSTNHNGRADCWGACAVYFPDEGGAPLCSLVTTNQGTWVTNIRVDHYSVLKAIEYANKLDPDRNRRLVVYTSNQLFVDWMTGGRKIDVLQHNNWENDGKLVGNHDLLENILRGEQTRGRAGIMWRHTKSTRTLKHRATAQKAAKSWLRQHSHEFPLSKVLSSVADDDDDE